MSVSNTQQSGHSIAQKYRGMEGYSLIEIVVVVIVIMILMAMSIPQLVNFKKRHKTEDQAVKVMDLMAEASQIAMTHRHKIRFELDRSDVSTPVARLVDENGPGTTDDRVMKVIPLEPMDQVRMDVAPAGITVPNPPNYPAAVYSSNRWAVSFTSTGSAVNASDLPVSATIFVWPPKSVPWNPSDLNPRTANEVRAITIYGGSGAIRFWKHNGTTFVPF